MSKINYLNLGCGKKYHKDWVNLDKYSDSSCVSAYDLFKNLPFGDNTFEVVYLSQILEHFPKKNAAALIRECCRVLKPEGIVRIVVPDLEDIAKNYLKFLDENFKNPTEESMLNYDWILLEMYDQTVRNVSGGEMAEYLRRPAVINEQFVLNRIGFVGKSIRDSYLQKEQVTKKEAIKIKILKVLDPKNWKGILNCVKHRIIELILRLNKEPGYSQIGRFRLSGEIHYWMYDRYSLGRLLKDCGFRDIKPKTPFDSDIPEWGKYELDIKNGQIYDPTSLFMEAKK